MLNQPSLIAVINGNPYQPGDKILLPYNEVDLGWISPYYRPDIPFSGYSSQPQLATIFHQYGKAILHCPKNSFLGIRVNGKLLRKDDIYELQNCDLITLSFDLVLRYCKHFEPNERIYIDSPFFKLKVLLDETNRFVMINRKKFFLQQEDQYIVFRYLFCQRPRTVSRKELKIFVWPGWDCSIIKDKLVDDLVHRLQTSLTPYGYIIRKRNYGYSLITAGC